jgi:hypothetical protein
MKQTSEEVRASGLPTWKVTFLPYLDFIGTLDIQRNRGYGYGSVEELYPAEQEAEARFELLLNARAVESLRLEKWTAPYRLDCRTLLREWNDSPE